MQVTASHAVSPTAFQPWRLLRRYGYEGVLLAVIGVLYALLAWREPLLRDPSSLLDATQHIAEIGIMAAAMTPIIVTAGIDLSVGSILGMSGIVLGYSWKWGLPLPAALVCAVLAGTLAGAINGLAVTRGRVPPLVVTLATLAIFRGVAYATSRAEPVSGFPVQFEDLFQFAAWDLVPRQLFLLVAVFAVGYVVLHHTVFGRYVYLIGSNERAARFAAVPVDRIKFLLYTASGAMAGVAAIVFTARSGVAKADAGVGYELEVITCVVLGGTRITGGRGSMAGTFLGVIAVLLVRTGLGYAGVGDVWRTLLLGIVLIGTACANQLIARGRAQ